MSRLAAFVHRRARGSWSAPSSSSSWRPPSAAPSPASSRATSRDFQDPAPRASPRATASRRRRAASRATGSWRSCRPGGDVRRDRAAAAVVRDVEATMRRDPGVERTLSWTSTRDPRLVVARRHGHRRRGQARPDADEEDATDRVPRGSCAAPTCGSAGGDVVGPGDRLAGLRGPRPRRDDRLPDPVPALAVGLPRRRGRAHAAARWARWRSSRPSCGMRVDQRLDHRPVDLRAEPRDRDRARPGDRLQPVRRLALPRGAGARRARGARRSRRTLPPPGGRCCSAR